MKNNEAVMIFQNKRCRIPLNLQYFAGDGGDGGAGGDPKPGDDKKPTFDEMLASGHKEEYDRRVQEAIDVAVRNAQDKWKTFTDDKISEAEKLAKMNEQEKAEYLQRKKEKELSDREADITKRELMATAKNTLTEKGIPLELAEVLNYQDADACNKSIAAVEKAFQSAVEKAVEERLKGGPTLKKPGSETESLEEEIKRAMNNPW